MTRSLRDCFLFVEYPIHKRYSLLKIDSSAKRKEKKVSEEKRASEWPRTDPDRWASRQKGATKTPTERRAEADAAAAATAAEEARNDLNTE